MPAAEATAATKIHNDELPGLFAGLERFDHIAIAVSGGADSTALMVLACRWQRLLDQRLRLSVLTVDHTFRPASAQEVIRVRDKAQALGLDTTVIEWTGPRPETGLQAAARAFRYRAMMDWCAIRGAGALLTGHTADDQAETFIMRLARGSGLDGLSAIQRWQTGDGAHLVRPLLAVSRARLEATLVACDQDWIDDPSNEDEAYERVRIRRMLPQLAADGLTLPAIGRSARRLARARQALEQYAARSFEDGVVVHETGYCRFGRSWFAALPAETGLRVLALAFRTCGADGYLRLAALEEAVSALGADDAAAKTLAGCRIAVRQRDVLVGREPGRLPQGRVALCDVRSRPWDNRFNLETDTEPDTALDVQPCRAVMLSGAMPEDLKRDRTLPDFVWQGLPVVLQGNTVAAMPHAGYHAPWFNGTVTVQRHVAPGFGEGPFHVG